MLPRDTRAGLSRRRFLTASSALAALAAAEGLPGWTRPAGAFGGRRSPPLPSGDLFSLGVASGDPFDRGLVLWTRLAPEPLAGGGMDPVPVDVEWELATDPGLQNVVQAGRVVARPEWGHAVHVKLWNLEPNRWYWYRFSVGDRASRVGRTRTMPAGDDLPARLRFALASCQNYQAGFYTAYANMAQEDLDLVVHVGDYIYESGISDGAVRPHNSGQVRTLDEYRDRYALYKLDPNLQDVHAAFPMIVTWDDHEVDNNYASDVPEDDQPREVFLARRAAAYQAYFEHMPLVSSARPTGPDMQLFRRFDYGRLARFNVLDTRQFRTDQVCGDPLATRCPDAVAPETTLVGQAQEDWLKSGLKGSQAVWNVLAQQVMMMEWDLGTALGAGEALYNPDQWDGYPNSRQRILDFVAAKEIPNLVVLTGDIHSSWAGELKPDFGDPASPVVGSEFVTTSISSSFSPQLVPLAAGSLPFNPHIRFFEGLRRGYLRFDVTPGEWRADYRAVATVLEPTSAVETLASFRVESGRGGVEAV
ncbi:MAG: alkaline phosphatase D family protein [Proteobacteria bacterium]|nr:alkaline phosphatase D family protein [Pseudomonadota bacterium]